jgi:hypothetical protein
MSSDLGVAKYLFSSFTIMFILFVSYSSSQDVKYKRSENNSYGLHFKYIAAINTYFFKTTNIL